MNVHQPHFNKTSSKLDKYNRKTNGTHIVIKKISEKMLKFPAFLKGRKKSSIAIHDDLASTPVVYSTPDGKDYYVYVKAKSAQQSAITPSIPTVPKKTFLVTVYGDDLEGVEDKVRHALSNPSKTTARPCSRVCEKPAPCPCEAKEEEEIDHGEQVKSPNRVLTIFPKAGQSLDRSPCVCPCCLCSCAEPGHENYGCGCEKSPPVPCPCSPTTSYTGNPYQSPVASPPQTPAPLPPQSLYPPLPQSPAPAAYSNYNYNCQCNPSSPAPCSCAANVPRSSENVVQSPMSPPPAPNSGSNSRTYHVGPYNVQDDCDCFCCPCSCPVTSTYTSQQCTCPSERQTSCPCRRDNV